MLTQAIENLLNRNLPRSPRAQELCAALAGKRVRIEARGLGWVLVAECLAFVDPPDQGRARESGRWPGRPMARSPAA